MADLTTILEENPWAREYLFLDPDLIEGDIIFETNLTKFTVFVRAMNETVENKNTELAYYDLPEHQAIFELLAVFKVMLQYETVTEEQRELFFNSLSSFLKDETGKGKSLDSIFGDKDAIALSRLYQVTDEEWTKKYMTWILADLGAISLTAGPDVFGANESAFTTLNFLTEASHGKWRPQMHFSVEKD
ncbi:hypothetical protein IRB23M11_22150 [Alkalibacterium sp. m-11]|uniref:Uncharacterized protein n=1 Tax=Alkalibacterium indicireducens TaxID=398758 RepID=A0ABP3L2H3_9LACT